MDRKLLYCTFLLAIGGMVMIYSSSSVMAESRFDSHFFFIKRQIMWLAIGLIAASVIIKVDLKKLSVYSVPALFITIILLAAVFIMPARNGSHRWLFLGPLSLQPSELFKLVVIFYLAFSLSNRRKEIRTWKEFLMPYAPLLGAGLMLIIFEPGLGSAIVISLTILVIFFLSGLRLSYLAALVLPLVATGMILVFGIGYKKQRVLDYLTAVKKPLDGSYQIKQAALTLGAGGIFGAGFGAGRQKMFFLPYPHTDFIFASIGEEIGFIGLIVILVLFFVIIHRGMMIAKDQPDRFGYLLASGITASLAVSIIINIGVVTSLLPTTGIPLPLMSYGGTALLVSICSIAVLLNLSRRKGMMVR